jgi:hypothetical protein
VGRGQAFAAAETAPPWLSFGPPVASLVATADTHRPWSPWLPAEAPDPPAFGPFDGLPAPAGFPALEAFPALVGRPDFSAFGAFDFSGSADSPAVESSPCSAAVAACTDRGW